MFELRNQPLQQWFAIAPGLTGQTMLLNSVWEQQRQLIAGPHRWRRVNNHLQAVIATGVDLGWDMQAPYRWKDAAGYTYEFDASDPTLAEQFTDHLAEQVRTALWQKAAQRSTGTAKVCSMQAQTSRCQTGCSEPGGGEASTSRRGWPSWHCKAHGGRSKGSTRQAWRTRRCAHSVSWSQRTPCTHAGSAAHWTRQNQTRSRTPKP